MTKIKVIFKSILFSLLMILFPVLSGVIVGILSSVTEKDYSVIGLYIQGIFILISIIIAFIYIKYKKIDFFELGLKTKMNKDYLYFLPCLLIFVPTLFNGFIWRSYTYFFGCLFLYILVGISEEVYFRGIIPNILKEKFNIYYLILISTLIFGFGHCAIIFINTTIEVIILTIINALIFGFLAILLKLLTKNIIFLMIIHFLFDFESKFIIENNSLIVYEIIRGVIMSIYSFVLLVVLIKRSKITIEKN